MKQPAMPDTAARRLVSVRAGCGLRMQRGKAGMAATSVAART